MLKKSMFLLVFATLSVYGQSLKDQQRFINANRELNDEAKKVVETYKGYLAWKEDPGCSGLRNQLNDTFEKIATMNKEVMRLDGKPDPKGVFNRLVSQKNDLHGKAHLLFNQTMHLLVEFKAPRNKMNEAIRQFRRARKRHDGVKIAPEVLLELNRADAISQNPDAVSLKQMFSKEERAVEKQQQAQSSVKQMHFYMLKNGKEVIGWKIMKKKNWIQVIDRDNKIHQFKESDIESLEVRLERVE